METKSIKSDINCILDNYERQVKELVSEAQSLSNELDNVQNNFDYNYYFDKINNIYNRQKAIEECYEDCIIDL